MYLCDNCKRCFPGDQILPGQVIIKGNKTDRLLLCNYCFQIEDERDHTRHFEVGENKKLMVENLSLFRKGVNIIRRAAKPNTIIVHD